MVSVPATFDWPLLRQLQGAGLLSIVPHPEHALFLLNYTPKAQYAHAWDAHPILLSCRGTIIDDAGRVVARPYRKFFNVSERPGLDIESLAAHGEPEVSHKYDGSMVTCTVNPYTKEVLFATRGSFTSRQAQMAARIWHERGCVSVSAATHVSLTMVFELVSPQNRIVVHYDDDDLILTGIIDNESGEEWSYSSVQNAGKYLGFRAVETEPLDWTHLDEIERSNFEGFVLFWPKAQIRVKAKLESYVQIHRIVTGLSASTVWELLRDGKPLEELRASIPEELHAWFDTTAGDLTTRYQGLASLVGVFMEGVRVTGLDPADRADRKKIAAQVVAMPPELRAPIFAALDGKDWQSAIWKMIEPSKETLFQKQGRTEEDEG